MHFANGAAESQEPSDQANTDLDGTELKTEALDECGSQAPGAHRHS